MSVPFIRAPPPDFAPPPPPPRETMSCFMRGLMCVFPTSKPAPIDTKYTFLSAVIQLEFVLICLGLFGLFMPGSVFISSAADMTKYVFHRDASYANLIAAMLNLMNFTGEGAGQAPAATPSFTALAPPSPIASCSDCLLLLAVVVVVVVMLLLQAA